MRQAGGFPFMILYLRRRHITPDAAAPPYAIVERQDIDIDAIRHYFIDC